MRTPICLLALSVGLSFCGAASAQDPISYDPTFYDQAELYSPNNPNSLYAIRQRKARAELLKKQQGGMLAKLQNFTKSAASGVVSLVNFLPPPTDPNDQLPLISTGPGSILQQPNSPAGSATDAQSPKPPKTSLFGNPTASSPSVFGNSGGNSANLFPGSQAAPGKQ